MLGPGVKWGDVGETCVLYDDGLMATSPNANGIGPGGALDAYMLNVVGTASGSAYAVPADDTG